MSQWRWWHYLSSSNSLLPVRRFTKPGLKSGVINVLSASCPASPSLTNHILLLSLSLTNTPKKQTYGFCIFVFSDKKNTSRNEKIKQDQMLLEIKHSWWINQDGVSVLSLLLKNNLSVFISFKWTDGSAPWLCLKLLQEPGPRTPLGWVLPTSGNPNILKL